MLLGSEVLCFVAFRIATMRRILSTDMHSNGSLLSLKQLKSSAPCYCHKVRGPNAQCTADTPAGMLYTDLHSISMHFMKIAADIKKSTDINAAFSWCRRRLYVSSDLLKGHCF